MVNVTAEFVRDRKTFLGNKIVLVPEPVDKGNGPRKFWFDEKGGYVALKAGSPGVSEADKSTVNAYWLSWDSTDIKVLDLGAGGDFFFTSHMTGCIFKVLTASAKTPKVAHIPGTMNTSVQLGKEADILAKVPEGDRGASKVLSIADGERHKYRGQSSKAKPGSAFVYGYKDTDGNWSFEAQIVKANLADEFVFKMSLKSSVPKIAPLYEIK